MSEDRFCIDCAHYWGHQAYQGLCRRERIGTDLVDGQPIYRGLDAALQRNPPGRWFGKDRCGPSGRYFKLRKPPTPPCGGTSGRK